MDSRKAANLKTRIASLPRISRRQTEWTPAAPSRLLNLGLAASWLGFLYTLGLFSTSSSEASSDPLSFADNLALLFFLVILGGIFAVVGLAISNHPATAAVSVGAAIAIIVLGATCGFAGHPVSAWGPDAALASAIAAASLAVMGRRAATE
jgi:hypothetical protein